MKEILEQYKNKLINLSEKNRSLCLKKNTKGRTVDIYKFIEIGFVSEEEVLDFLFDPTKELCIFNNLTQTYNSKFEEAFSSFSKKDLPDVSFEDSDELSMVEEWNKKAMNLDFALKEIDKQIVSTKKETGKYELYIGYPFVEGLIGKNKSIKAPLWLFSVILEHVGGTWVIKHSPESSPILNEVLLLSYYTINEETPQKHLSSMEEFNEWLGEENENTFIRNCVNYLDSINVYIKNKEVKDNIKPFKEMKKDDFLKLPEGLSISPNLILGQFPIATSIYYDYENMLNELLKNDSVERLLVTRNSSGDGGGSVDIEEYDSKRKDIYTFTNLDYSQEDALIKVNENSDLVIYGPPGTGKSETIANIIVDNIYKGQKVLVVSQKKAALDVIFNRLSAFKPYIMKVTDTIADKKLFYGKIKESFELYEEFKSNSANEFQENLNRIEVCSEDIEKEIKALSDIAKVLHKETEYGLSLYEMYVTTKKIDFSDNNSKTDNYIKLYENNPFFNEKYNNLKDALQVFDNEDKVYSIYTKYEMDKTNPQYKNLQKNLNPADITIFLRNYEKIKSALNDFISLYKEDSVFVESANFYLKTNGDRQGIDELALDINTKNNGDLLTPLNTGNKFNPIFWIKYSKNQKIENENKILFEKHLDEYKSKIESNLSLIDNFINTISKLENILTVAAYSNLLDSFLKGVDIIANYKLICTALENYDTYIKLYKDNQYNTNLQGRIFDFIFNSSCNFDEFNSFGKSFLELQTIIHINSLLKNDDDVNILDKYKTYPEIRNRIESLSGKRAELVKQSIESKCINDVYTALSNLELTSKKTFNAIKREGNKVKMLKSLREYIGSHKDELLELYPCWLLNPETVSDILPLQENLFDIVIFDEASQLLVEKSLPAIFRGKKIVVAGDDKQLQPNELFGITAGIQINEDEDEFEEDCNDVKAETDGEIEEENTEPKINGSDKEDILENKSLLDMAKSKFKEAHLNYHYRSTYSELIDFSNYAFYSGKLNVSPNTNNKPNGKPPIERIKVDGRWIDKRNEVEADEIVSLLENILENKYENESVGIITFNVNQRSLIEDKLERRAAEDGHFNNIYMEAVNLNHNGEDKGLFVKNIENVQGDERDIIIFSIGYAKNEKGRVYSNFGPLNKDGGENRLNVAISRAKSKIYVVTSIEPEELHIADTAKNGAKLFKKYLQYVKFVSDGDMDSVQNLLNSILDTEVTTNTSLTFDSDFEEQVYDKLIAKGINVHTQIGVSGYRIDLAVYNEIENRYILGIECDGATYHSSRSARERDIYRQKYLEGRGWEIARIWSPDWWSNPDEEIEKIIRRIEGLKK